MSGSMADPAADHRPGFTGDRHGARRERDPEREVRCTDGPRLALPAAAVPIDDAGHRAGRCAGVAVGRERRRAHAIDPFGPAFHEAALLVDHLVTTKWPAVEV